MRRHRDRLFVDRLEKLRDELESMGNVDPVLLDRLNIALIEIDEGFKSPRRAAEDFSKEWGFMKYLTKFDRASSGPVTKAEVQQAIASHKEKIMWRIKDTLTDIAVEEARQKLSKEHEQYWKEFSELNDLQEKLRKRQEDARSLLSRSGVIPSKILDQDTGKWVKNPRFAEAQEAARAAAQFIRVDDFYSGDFYVPQIGHRFGYRGDFEIEGQSEVPSNVTKDGIAIFDAEKWSWYHFGRLASVEHDTATEEIFFTNELGQVIRFGYENAEDAGYDDAGDMIKMALQRKGQPIVVMMRNNRVDPTSTDDIFMDWQLDEKGVVADTNAETRASRDAGRIESVKVRNSVSKHKRNLNAHNAKPNWRWIDIGVLRDVAESRLTIALQSESRKRYFFHKKDEDWQEFKAIADKLEGSKVLLCVASPAGSRRERVIDIVDANNPMDFLVHRVELQSAEIERRNEAMAEAKENHSQAMAEINEAQTREALIYQEGEKQLEKEMAAKRQQLQNEWDVKRLALDEHEKLAKRSFEADYKSAKDRSDLQMQQRQNTLTSIVTLQEFLREKEQEERKETVRAPKGSTKHVRGSADISIDTRLDAMVEGAAKIGQDIGAKANSAVAVREMMQNSLDVTASPTEDEKDWKIRALEADLRAERAEKKLALSEKEQAEVKTSMAKLQLSSHQFRSMSDEDRQGLLAQLDDHDQKVWTEEQRKEFFKRSQKLVEELKPKMGMSIPVNIAGYYPRAGFAMRTGKVLSDDDKVTIELKEHLNANQFLVYIEEHLVETIACLVTDKRNDKQICVINFLSQRNGWEPVEREITGFKGKIKNGLSMEECVEFFKETEGTLDFREL